MTGKIFMVFVAAVTLTSILSCAHSWSDTAPQSDSSTASSEGQVDGWYYGSSEDPTGRVSWFLQLDSRTSSGKIYLPPQILTLRNLVIQSGKVSFEFGENSDDARFDGMINDGLTGKFSYLNGRSFEAHLTRIEEQWLNQNYAAYAGLYSNVRFVEEAGDLVGAELLLVPLATGLGGSLTEYEGVPGNIYALTNVQMKDGSIAFAVVTHNGLRNFNAELSSDKVVIKRTANQNIEPNPLLLTKRKNLVDSLSSNHTTVP